MTMTKWPISGPYFNWIRHEASPICEFDILRNKFQKFCNDWPCIFNSSETFCGVSQENCQKYN